MHLRLDRRLLKKLDYAVNSSYYSNRTEFIRDGIQKALLEFERRGELGGLKAQKGR